MKKLTLAAALLSALLAGCVTTNGGTVANYSMGDDSAAIKQGRNRASAQLSRAELDQHRRQRTNTSEELDLEAKKRRNQQEEVAGNMGLAGGALGILGGIRNLRRGW